MPLLLQLVQQGGVAQEIRSKVDNCSKTMQHTVQMCLHIGKEGDIHNFTGLRLCTTDACRIINRLFLSRKKLCKFIPEALAGLQPWVSTTCDWGAEATCTTCFPYGLNRLAMMWCIWLMQVWPVLLGLLKPADTHSMAATKFNAVRTEYELLLGKVQTQVEADVPASDLVRLLCVAFSVRISCSFSHTLCECWYPHSLKQAPVCKCKRGRLPVVGPHATCTMS